MGTSTPRDLRSSTIKRKDAASDTRPRTTLSFYRYVRVVDVLAFKKRLLQQLSELNCLGRIYVASEGINAQLNVPNTYWDAFDAWIQAQPELRGITYNIAVEDLGIPSFFKLAIKIKDKIVADGLDDASFDVTNTGDYFTASEMNAYLEDEEAVVVDIRNNYESEVGHFQGAIMPDVATFKEELRQIPDLLRVHKHKKIALYCTGGIRCEKASAWLKHNGYQHVRHLQGGIVGYAHQVQKQGLDNKFRGKNFVFDERLGERISAEVISTCHLCRTEKSDTHFHCKNQICYGLFIGCDTCMTQRNGYCSWKCVQIAKLPKPTKKVIARYINQFIIAKRPFQKIRMRH